MHQISIEKPNFCKYTEIGLFNYASFYNIFYKDCFVKFVDKNPKANFNVVIACTIGRIIKEG